MPWRGQIVGREDHVELPCFLPGLSVLLGAMWIMKLSYWGFNQYIIQRALGAKSVEEAQKGVAFAAFLKLLVPVLGVIPGIAASVLVPGLERADEAYPAMMALAPDGVRGLILAGFNVAGAIVAAILTGLYWYWRREWRRKAGGRPRSGREHAADAAYRLADALLVLDKRKAHVALPRPAEARAR